MISPKAYASILVAVLLWSASFVLVKIGLTKVTPIYLAALRFSLATAIFAGCALAKFEMRQIKTFTKNNFAVLFALGIVGVHVLYNSIMSSILQNSSPALTLILAAIFLHESLGYRKVSGLVLSFIGVTIISLNGSFSLLGDSMVFYGNLMLLSSRCVTRPTPSSAKRSLQMIAPCSSWPPARSWERRCGTSFP